MDAVGPNSLGKRKPGYEPIEVSEVETWTTTQFIDFYLHAQGYAVGASNRELVRVMIRQYDGPRPIKASELMEFLACRAPHRHCQSGD